jgi:kinase domain protein
MGTYIGYKRPDRLKEMVSFMRMYKDGTGTLVRAIPMDARKLPGRVIDKPIKGGQARFYFLKDSGGKLGIKAFNSSENPDFLKKRARNVQNALQKLNDTYERDNLTEKDNLTITMLFNQLNIPKGYFVDKNGRLAALLIPKAPDSCYKTIYSNAKGKEVKLRSIISENSYINTFGKSNSGLIDVAKWSLLDSFCQTIASLHSLQLIHGDLSSSNTFVRWAESTDPKVYVIDAFNGYSYSDGNKELGVMISDVYCPISVRRCEYTPSSDVYCLAWWIMHIAFGMDPGAIDSPRPKLQDIKNGAPILFARHNYVVSSLPKARKQLSNEFFNVLESCLCEGPENRPDAIELACNVHNYWKDFGDER